jgi:hypothetical protein
MSDAIRLNDFIHAEHERLLKFGEFWMREHWKEPEKWPLRLEHGEWDEQLQIFRESNETVRTTG